MKTQTMKKIITAAFLFLSLFSWSQVTQLIPYNTPDVFNEEDRLFAYHEIEGVIVSMAFESYINGEYVMELTIDNQSDDTLRFDPSKIYLFRYNNDSLLDEAKLYTAIDADSMLNSLENQANVSKKKKNRSIAASVFLGAALLTAEVAGYNGNISYETLELFRFTHDVAQMGLDISRQKNAENLCNIYYTAEYWSQGALGPVTLYPHTYKSGNIHFKVPSSCLYKFYLPVDDRLYRFMFTEVEE